MAGSRVTTPSTTGRASYLLQIYFANGFHAQDSHFNSQVRKQTENMPRTLLVAHGAKAGGLGGRSSPRGKVGKLLTKTELSKMSIGTNFFVSLKTRFRQAGVEKTAISNLQKVDRFHFRKKLWTIHF